MDSQQIILYAALAFILVWWIRRRVLSSAIPQVDVEEAERRSASGTAVLVDVRTGRERSRGTLRGSLHLPLHELSRLEPALGSHKDREVIFFCASGSRSMTAALKAKKLGFKSVNLSGGIG